MLGLHAALAKRFARNGNPPGLGTRGDATTGAVHGFERGGAIANGVGQVKADIVLKLSLLRKKAMQADWVGAASEEP